MSYKNFTTSHINHSYTFLRAIGLVSKDKSNFKLKPFFKYSSLDNSNNLKQNLCRSTSLPGPSKIARIDEIDTPNSDEAIRVLITDFDQEYYHMSHKFRGVALLINIRGFRQ